jgi:hypothetical protein
MTFAFYLGRVAGFGAWGIEQRPPALEIHNMGCQSLMTVGAIAQRLGQPLHRIEYLCRARGITPKGWAGHARVFDEGDVAYIAYELRRIDEKRSRKSAQVRRWGVRAPNAC